MRLYAVRICDRIAPHVCKRNSYRIMHIRTYIHTRKELWIRSHHPSVSIARGGRMMSEKSAEPTQQVRALAFIIGELRPRWPAGLIETHLTTATLTRPFGELCADAVDCANSPNVKAPGALVTHRAIGDVPRSTPVAIQVTRCATCGGMADEWHNCRPPKPSPEWHERRRELAAKYTLRLSGLSAAESVPIIAEWQKELTQ
jgi:hypothetical protein